MHRYLLLALMAIGLFGCQSKNPYQAASLASATTPDATANPLTNNAYPTDYRYWCWDERSASAIQSSANQTRTQHVLVEQLEQYALRASPSAEQCQLKVQLSTQQQQRVRRDYYDDYYPSAYYNHGYGHGYGYYGRHRYSGIGFSIPLRTRSYTEYYQQLQLVFSDAASGQIIWQSQTQVSSNARAETSEQALRDGIKTMLDSFR